MSLGKVFVLVNKSLLVEVLVRALDVVKVRGKPLFFKLL